MFLHNYIPQPLILELGFLKIHWYGLIIALATIVGLYLVIKLNNKSQKNNIIIFENKDQIYDLYFYIVLSGLLGARIYDVVLFLPLYTENLIDVFKVWNGGLAIHGGIIGGVLTIIFYCRKNKISTAGVFDLVAVALPFSQAIGRCGNYFNQELVGLPTKLPWSIPIEIINRPTGFKEFEYFHPTFLYESLLNLILFSLLIYLYNKRLKNKKLSNIFFVGSLFLVYLVGYSVIRFALEFVKIDETAMLFGMRWPQVVSVLFVIVATVLFCRLKILHKKQNNN